MKKIFRDPIYNLITFDKKNDLLLLRLIDTYEFQRLRRIRQLGLSWLTYPTAVHTRFSHSLGVAYLSGKIFDNLNLENAIEFDDNDGHHKLTKTELKLLLQTAALLHDIGHGPFSHAFEKIMRQDHEKWSIEIITNENTNINKIILEDDEKLNEVILLDKRKNFPKWISDILNGIFPLAYINDIISSQLDADRLDYLLRDAYICGVKYAKFDLDWILNNIILKEITHEGNRKGIVINAEKGIYSIESFIISRYHMYEQVYFHKTTRAAEKLMQNIFERMKELIRNKETEKIAPVDKSLIALSNEEISVKDFLKLDDFMFITYINRWAFNCGDKILKQLCYNFVHRNLYKLVKETKNIRLFSPEQYENISDFFKKRNLDKKYYLVFDDYTNVPYKDDYLFGKTNSEDAHHIWLMYKNNAIKDLGEASDIIRGLRNNLKYRYRVYCDRKLYQDFKDKILNKEDFE